MSIMPQFNGFEALPQTSEGSNLAINSSSRFALATLMLHRLHSQPAHPNIQGLISEWVLSTRRVGGLEHAHASKTFEQV